MSKQKERGKTKTMPTKKQLDASYINALHIEKMILNSTELKKYRRKIENVKNRIAQCRNLLYGVAEE